VCVCTTSLLGHLAAGTLLAAHAAVGTGEIGGYSVCVFPVVSVCVFNWLRGF
jgi:hypothetical protein